MVEGIERLFPGCPLVIVPEKATVPEQETVPEQATPKAPTAKAPTDEVPTDDNAQRPPKTPPVE